jgi:hypothetical protein
LPCPSHPLWLDHSNYIWRRVQDIKLLIIKFPPNKIINTKSFKSSAKYRPEFRCPLCVEGLWDYV